MIRRPPKSSRPLPPFPYMSLFRSYELIAPDPEGAKAFYDAVVGWSIGEQLPGAQDYRRIGRGDGGFAGGELGLTDDMRQHGARPILDRKSTRLNCRHKCASRKPSSA